MTILNNALAAPMLGMLLLTLLVWTYLFVQRIGYSKAHGIDIEKFKNPGDAASLVPGPLSTASDMYGCLCEEIVLARVRRQVRYRCNESDPRR